MKARYNSCEIVINTTINYLNNKIKILFSKIINELFFYSY